MIHLIESIKISQPAHRALKSAGIETLEQLTQYTEKDLLALHGLGPMGVEILKKSLKEYGILLKEEESRT